MRDDPLRNKDCGFNAGHQEFHVVQDFWRLGVMQTKPRFLQEVTTLGLDHARVLEAARVPYGPCGLAAKGD